MDKDKFLNEFYEIFRKTPSEIMSSKYNYMSIIFPDEYIKGLKNYINVLELELKNLKTIITIRSKL